MPNISVNGGEPGRPGIAAKSRASLTVALALVLATTASCAAVSEQNAAVRDLDRRIAEQNFNPKLGDKVFRVGKIILTAVYSEGRCIPLSNGVLGSAELPYGNEFGSDPREANKLAMAIINSPFGIANMGFSYDVRYAGNFFCISSKYLVNAEQRFVYLKIYFETAPDAFQRRKAELAGRLTTIISEKHGHLPDCCAIFASATDYWIDEAAVVIHTDHRGRLDLSDITQVACLLRGAAVTVGMVGVLNIGDQDLLHKDFRDELQDYSQVVSGYSNATGRVAFYAALVPGMGKDEAMKLIRETEFYKFRAEKRGPGRGIA